MKLLALSQREEERFVTLIRKKVDWLKFYTPMPVSISSKEILEIIRDFDLNLVPESKTMWRDPLKHIALHFHDKWSALEFEGQFFKTSGDFLKALRAFRKLNEELVLNPEECNLRIINNKYMRWHITRLDVAHDYLDCTPDMLIPSNLTNYEVSFNHHHCPWSDGKNKVLQTIYYTSRRFVIRSYRKDIEIRSKEKTKKGFYDLNDPIFKNRPISRFEVELAHSSELKTANYIFLSDIEPMENEFVDAVLRDFVERKTIRKIQTLDKNKSRWPLIPLWECLKAGTALKIPATREYLRRSPYKGKLLKAAISRLLNEARKHDLTSEEVLSEVSLRAALELRSRKLKAA